MTLLHYWHEYFLLHTLFEQGTLDPKAPGLYPLPKTLLDQEGPLTLSLPTTQTVLLAPWLALDQEGRYILPLLLRYRYQQGTWTLQTDPVCWVPFGLFDPTLPKPPLGRERDYETCGWQDFEVNSAQPLSIQVQQWLRVLYPTLGKARQAALGLTVQPFALCIVPESYLNYFPLASRLWQGLSLTDGSIGNTRYFLGEVAPTPSVDLPNEQALRDAALTMGEGQCRALRTPIGSKKIEWTWDLLANAWLEHGRQGKAWKALLLTAPLVVENWIQGFEDHCWDPASQLIVNVELASTTMLSRKERQLSFLLSAKQATMQAAVAALSTQLEKTVAGLKEGARLLEVYSIEMVPPCEEMASLQKMDVILEQKFDQVGESVLAFEGLKRRANSWRKWFQKSSAAKAFQLFKQRYQLPEDLTVESVMAFLGIRLRTLREERAQIHERLKEASQKLVQWEQWQNAWESWWKQYRDGVPLDTSNTVEPAAWLLPLRQQLFWLSWHLEEAKALLQERAPVLSPLLYWQDPTVYLSPLANTQWLGSFDWLVIDNAQQLPVVSGLLWLSLAKRAVLLGDEQQFSLPLAHESQVDFQHLRTQALVQTEADFEDLEYLGLVCSRNSAWQRAQALQEVGWALEERVGSPALQFWELPGVAVLEEEQLCNPEQAALLLDRLEEWLPKQGQPTLAIVTPFIRQQQLLQEGLLARGLMNLTKIEVLKPEQLQGQLYEVVILSMVLTAKDQKPLCYDRGPQLWSTLSLSAGLSLYIAGDRALFDPKLHSPTGKIAKALLAAESTTIPLSYDIIHSV